jgi:hypothetical protein
MLAQGCDIDCGAFGKRGLKRTGRCWATSERALGRRGSSPSYRSANVLSGATVCLFLQECRIHTDPIVFRT